MKRFLLVAVITVLISCTKDVPYAQKPTCRHYLLLSYKWDGEMRPRPGHFPDTLRTPDMPDVTQTACGRDLDTIRAYVPKVTGCLTGGYEMIVYDTLYNPTDKPANP